VGVARTRSFVPSKKETENLNNLLAKVKSPNYLNSLKNAYQTGAVSSTIFRLAKEQGVENRENVKNAIRALYAQNKKRIIKQFTNDMIQGNDNMRNAVNTIKSQFPKYKWSKIDQTGLTNKQKEILKMLTNNVGQ
jgi:molecular chaperone GrpE (heat shock protein)